LAIPTEGDGVTFEVPVLWVSWHDDILARGYSDQGFLEAVLAREVWCPQDPIGFVHHEVRGSFPDVEGAVVVINGRTHAGRDDVRRFLTELDRLSWSVVLLCGDEEWVFPWEKVRESSRRQVWVMQGVPRQQGLGWLPGGWYPRTRELMDEAAAPEKCWAWFFAGQVTHERRQECAEVLRSMVLSGPHVLIETERYLEEKLSRANYMQAMTLAKVVPCPSGPYSVDCARTFEALEAGAIPVADVKPAYRPAFDYWRMLLGDHGFPTIEDWTEFPKILDEILAEWPANANRVYAHWQQWKRGFALRLEDGIRAVADEPRAPACPDDEVTVGVTTSPVPLHPSTDHIVEVIDSIRAQLPRAEIVVVADGVRPEQEHMRAGYEEYLRRLLWLTNFRWPNVVPVVLDEWRHQAGATAVAVELVRTEQVLFVEHDTPIVGAIDWPGLCDLIGSGTANAVRLHQDEAIHPDHERVMLDHETLDVMGVPVRRTAAWWQRPHLASTRFYRERILSRFTLASRTMIEDAVYPVVWADCEDFGASGWEQWRLYVYTPADGSYLGMRRSGHLDSRGDAEKFPMKP